MNGISLQKWFLNFDRLFVAGMAHAASTKLTDYGVSMHIGLLLSFTNSSVHKFLSSNQSFILNKKYLLGNKYYTVTHRFYGQDFIENIIKFYLS